MYGPGQKYGLIPAVVRNLINNETVQITGDGNQSRDYVFVDDVVKLLINAIEHPMYSSIMNIGSGTSVSVNDVVNICAEILNILNPHIEHIPKMLDRDTFVADIELIKTIYKFKPTPFAEGIVKTIKSYQES